jgi:hypothetical protein
MLERIGGTGLVPASKCVRAMGGTELGLGFVAGMMLGLVALLDGTSLGARDELASKVLQAAISSSSANANMRDACSSRGRCVSQYHPSDTPPH